MSTLKTPASEDVLIGRRVRLRRMELGLSQEKLGETLDLTFQQIQKYEKGANRVSGSRLVQMSRALQVPVEYFFQDVPGASTDNKVDGDRDIVSKMLTLPYGVALAQAYTAIPHNATRHIVLQVAEAVAVSQGGA